MSRTNNIDEIEAGETNLFPSWKPGPVFYDTDYFTSCANWSRVDREDYNGSYTCICCNLNTSAATDQTKDTRSRGRNQEEFYIGLILAISSSIFIGSSFILKKKGLLRVANRSTKRANSGSHAYLKDWLWWAGLLIMGLGEGLNFTAYAFAPASLVTPLGALSLIVTAVLSSRLLDERLNTFGKIGSFLCILGSTIIVLHSPKEGEVHSMDDLQEKLQQTSFIVYGVMVVAVSALLVFYFAPRYAEQNVLVYISICSLIGSLSVLACKGLGLAIKETAHGRNEFANWLTYFCTAAVGVCIAVQMNYLNKALDKFNTAIVNSIYYVFFTTAVIVASAILFDEWRHQPAMDIVDSTCGFLTVVAGVFLINAFKDVRVSFQFSKLKMVIYSAHHQDAGDDVTEDRDGVAGDV